MSAMPSSLPPPKLHRSSGVVLQVNLNPSANPPPQPVPSAPSQEHHMQKKVPTHSWPA